VPEECRVISTYPLDHIIYILRLLDMYELRTVFLDSWEAMEVLYEVLACLHHTVAFFYSPEEVSVFLHRREDLIECRFVVPRQETPWITERCSSDHKSI
jgi:hypothetical protein